MFRKLKISNEFKVGFFILAALSLALGFALFVGAKNPFTRSLSFYVTYKFAGGLEVGSPVRVAGIKVGQIEEIEFFTTTPANTAISQQEPGSDQSTEDTVITPIRVRVSLHPKAAEGVRKDSRFYINMAGVIGERYLEITPGTYGSPKVQTGDTLAGVDPPRIDQLLSQSFDLAGKIIEVVDKNKGDITKTIESLYKLSANVNKTIDQLDKSKVFTADIRKLATNLIDITSDVMRLTDRMGTPEGDKTLKLLHALLCRLEPLDATTTRPFLQKEGIRARIF